MSLDPGEGLVETVVTTPDGRALRTVRGGEGGPVVVFEAGMAACASEWVTVQRLVAGAAHTVSYDRAGYTTSSVDPRPRTLDRLAADLLAVVDAVAPRAPVVLAGHSWGGPIVRCFAAAHPDRVAGVVLVDSTVTAVMSVRQARAAAVGFRILTALSAVRLAAGALRSALRQRPSADMTDRDRGIVERDFVAHGSVRAGARESREIAGSLGPLAEWEIAGLPEVPVVAVVGGVVDRGQEEVRPALIDSAAAEMARHPLGELRVVDGAGHFVPLEQPAAVASAVRYVVAAVRAGA